MCKFCDPSQSDLIKHGLIYEPAGKGKRKVFQRVQCRTCRRHHKGDLIREESVM